MKRFSHNPRNIVLVLMVALSVCGCSSVGKPIVGVENFATVDDGSLYRGAQPQRKGMQTLASRGVKTIVNLRDDPQTWEVNEARRLGMNYVSIPSSASRVREEQVVAFLDALATQPAPVFVHCAVGCDRTGLEIAVYRIVHQKWAREEAVRELYALGYHWALYPGIERYVRTCDLARLQAQLHKSAPAKPTASAVGPPPRNDF